MSPEYQNHTEGEIKHQVTHKHCILRPFLSLFDYPPSALGKAAGARGTAKVSRALSKFLSSGGKCETILKLSLVYYRFGQMSQCVIPGARLSPLKKGGTDTGWRKTRRKPAGLDME